jgi:hypothetical protein
MSSVDASKEIPTYDSNAGLHWAVTSAPNTLRGGYVALAGLVSVAL